MNRNRAGRFSSSQLFLGLSFVLVLVLTSVEASAQTTVTSNPANLATGVSPSADVVFTFSGPMDTTSVTVAFYTFNPPGAYLVDSVWNNANDVLTCTPTSPFPNNTSISWIVSGMDVNSAQVIGQGSFTTGTGSGGGATGYGTNQITGFYVGKVYVYAQGGPNLTPVPTSFAPFIFSGTTVLASNRLANNITLTLPNNAVSNLTQNILSKENYYLSYFNASSNTFESTFPPGTYSYTVNATASNQTVAVTMPPSMTQPNAPQIVSFTAAQAVDVSKPFTLSWMPIAGGSSSDFVLVTIGDWTSPEVGTTNALDGTSTSIVIPAGALHPNSNYTASVGIEHAIFSTNSSYVTGAYRATLTEFSLKTTAGVSAPRPVLSNAGWTGSDFGFDIDTTSGQIVTVVYSADPSLPLSQWQKLISTNSPGAKIHISDPNAALMPALYYNVRNGP